jgi:predicted phage terminase large subunit-like protein
VNVTRDAAAIVYNEEDALIYSERWYKEARRNFWIFRLIMHPEMLAGWWQINVARHMMWFYSALLAGRRPKLVLMAPPQHGKSVQIRDFVAWMLGLNPDLRIIFASYSEDLGVNANLYLQRLMDSEQYKQIFGKRLDAGDGFQRNSSVLEMVEREGSFRNTTVQGPITGFGLDLGIVDDPIKGRAEAQSKLIRDKTWSWFTDDFFLRFSEKAGMIMILTRWHVDDPAGRFIEKFSDTRVVSYQAVAEAGDWSVRAGHRAVGVPLFEEHKSLEFLLERRRALTQASWEALYQQHPVVVGGGIIPVEKLGCINTFNKDLIKKSIRYIDKAATEDGGAYTAMVLMHEMKNGQFVISHVMRGQWASLEREERLRILANLDAQRYGFNYEVWVEQEPGSGGKESVEATIRNLRGLVAYADKVTGTKEVRAEPFAAQVQNNNVRLVAGDWNAPFLEEAEIWPQGKYRDQIDAAAGAFNKLTGGVAYDHTYAGWQ